MTLFHRRAEAVDAIQIPQLEDVEGRKAVEAFIHQRDEVDVDWDESGWLMLGGQTMAGSPGAWVVVSESVSGFTFWDDDTFVADYVSTADYTPTFKPNPVMEGLPLPPPALAALSALAAYDKWPNEDHSVFAHWLIEVVQRQMPPGFVGLKIEDLWKALDRAEYEKLQQTFTRLPDMPQLIATSTSIGAARNGHH